MNKGLYEVPGASATAAAAAAMPRSSFSLALRWRASLAYRLSSSLKKTDENRAVALPVRPVVRPFRR